MLTPMDPKVVKLAQAIAKAEGFGPPDNLPTRINNPCDLELGDRGYGVQALKTIFPTLEEGWAAAYHECWLMLTGTSHFYNPAKSIQQVAVLYTGNDNANAWAQIVSDVLGLDGPYDTLQDYLDLAS